MLIVLKTQKQMHVMQDEEENGKCVCCSPQKCVAAPPQKHRLISGISKESV